MKTAIIIGLILIGLFLLWLCWYSIDRTNSYYEALVSNFAATLFGAMIGVWITLSINQVQDQKEAENVIEDKRSKKDLIARLIIQELVLLQNNIRERINHPPETVSLLALKTSTWDSIRSTGELKIFEDVGLISKISEIYFLVESVKKLEDFSLSLYNGPTLTLVGSNPSNISVFQRSIKEARSQDQVILSKSENVINDLQRSIRNIPNPMNPSPQTNQ